jgi:hypothetical protein
MTRHAKKTEPAHAPVSYECDYYGWIQHNVRAIRERRLKEVDWPNVAEELEDMGKSERRALRSQLARLISHLLKWRYQPEGRRISEHSWRASIVDARRGVRELVDESPSFKPQLPQMFSAAYGHGVAQAASETNLPMDTFPQTCPWPLEEVMADDFWPEA